MGEIVSYKDLDVWKQARVLVKVIYQLTSKFPRDEQYGLVNQLRRAAVSVPSNIAEGCGRNHKKDSTQFFYISRGSLYEIETQLIVSTDLQLISEDELKRVLEHVTRCTMLINGFINYFQKHADNEKRTTANELLVEYISTDQQRTTINEQLETYGNSSSN